MSKAHNSATTAGLAPETDGEKTLSKRSKWAWRLVTAIILIAGFGGFIALQKFKPVAQVKPIVHQLPSVRTFTLQLQSGALPVRGDGIVQPRSQVTLAAEISARVSWVHPQLVNGGAFTKNDVLIRLDNAPSRAALRQARADLSAAKAAEKLSNQLFGRTKNLIAKGFMSQQTLDERGANLDQARASLAKAKAVETQRRLDFARTTIKAPFSGRVLSANINAGDTVQPGRELARIFDQRALEVTVSLSDADMALVDNPWGANPTANRAKAMIHVLHGGIDYRWPASLDRVEAALDSATRTFKVIVTADKPTEPGKTDRDKTSGPPLVVGMFASVTIAGRDQGEYALLPEKALREGDTLWLLNDALEIEIVQAELLSHLDGQVAIAGSGFKTGQQIVISDLNVVTQGMRVRNSESTPASREQPRRHAASTGSDS